MSKIDRLSVLVVTPCLPYPPVWGFATRVYHFLRHLSSSHDVSLLTYVEPWAVPGISVVQQLGIRVHVVPAPDEDRKQRGAQFASLFSRRSFHGQRLQLATMQAALDRLLAVEHFDIIQVESTQMSGFDFGRNAVVLLDEHNIEYELLHRMSRAERSPARKLFNGIESGKFRSEERRAWRQANGCILTSAREQQILREYLASKPTVVVPNGVDIEYFHPSDIDPKPGAIVFTGLMRYRPNIDGAVYFVDQILPQILRLRPDASLTIVGGDPAREVKQLAGPKVTVTGAVPDVRPFVQQAAAFVVPLRMGSGTRLKVLEGMAMGKAIVSTTLGCEGIEARDHEHLLLADDPSSFARAVVRLLKDADLATKLGKQGRLLVESEYGWASVTERLDAFYDAVLRSPAQEPHRSLSDRVERHEERGPSLATENAK